MALLANLFKRQLAVPIALYHMVYESTNSPLIATNIHNVTPENLEVQLKSLCKKYKVISLDELVERFLSGKNIAKTAAVTFDDGYLSVLRDAFPIFDSLNIGFTFFVNGKILDESTFWRDKVRMLIQLRMVEPFINFIAVRGWNIDSSSFYKGSKHPSVNSKKMEELVDLFIAESDFVINADSVYCKWDDLISSNSDKVAFGNHSYSHYVLSSLSKDEQYFELNKNQAIIRQNLGKESSVFSIPFGNEGTYNDDTLSIIKDLGYKGYALSVPFHMMRKPEIDRYGLVRLTRFMPENSAHLPI